MKGKINETGRNIIFITKQGASVGSYNSVLIIDNLAVILFVNEVKPIDRIEFTGPEINAIHPVGSAFSCMYNEEESKAGVISNQKKFDSTTGCD